MHANTSELLAARDGELGVSSSHIAQCEHCQQELRKLGAIANELHNLPELNVPDGAWENIIKVHKQSPQQRAIAKVVSINRGLYTLAASVLVVGFTFLFYVMPSINNAPSTYLTALQSESRTLEYTLANYENSISGLSKEQQFRIEQLEWKLMMLDQQLSALQHQYDGRQLEKIWSTRVDNLNALHAAYSGRAITATSEDGGLL